MGSLEDKIEYNLKSDSEVLVDQPLIVDDILYLLSPATRSSLKGQRLKQILMDHDGVVEMEGTEQLS